MMEGKRRPDTSPARKESKHLRTADADRSSYIQTLHINLYVLF